MLGKMRRKLALLCTGTTFVVFLLMIVLIASVTEKQYRVTNDMLFRSNVEIVLRKLQDGEIKNSWLSEMEISKGCIIAIEDNGQPLYFPGAWSPVSGRNTLITNARSYAADEMKVDYRSPPLLVERAEFLFTEQNAQYRCAVVVLPLQQNWVSLTMLSDMQLENKTVYDRRILYSIISLGVLGILCVFSWWFTGKAVAPIRENMEKQREFIASASHELKSPLTVIKSSLAAIQAEPSARERLLQRIERVCGQMERLVSDMLLLANSEQKSWQIEPVPVEMDVLLIETVEECRDSAHVHGFSLELDLPEEILPPVYGDAQRLRQVLTILIDNASSHAQIPGTILVKAYVHKQQLFVEVIDHGVGIASDMREKVFDRFFCTDQSRTEKSHFGLGLPIARELILLHAGSIRAMETPGGGCTFRVLLPLQDTKKNTRNRL